MSKKTRKTSVNEPTRTRITIRMGMRMSRGRERSKRRVESEQKWRVKTVRANLSEWLQKERKDKREFEGKGDVSE